MPVDIIELQRQVRRLQTTVDTMAPPGTIPDGPYAPLNKQFVIIGPADADLTAERVLTQGDGIGITDAGANAAVTIAVDGTVVRTSRTVTAGAGLTDGGALSADITLNVGAGNGITVNANDVALTTPGTLTAATSNSAAGNHTHAITASSNPGAAASLLKTDASGNLGLVNLTLTGDIDVQGGNINNTAGPITLTPKAGDNVGIGTATLPAALTVAGGGSTWTTAGWGRAIQVDNATVIKWYGASSFGFGQTGGNFYLIRSTADDASAAAIYPLIVNGTSNLVTLLGDIDVQGGDLKNTTGAITVTPKAGDNLNVALSGTGDFVVNTDQLVVDTSANCVTLSGGLHVGGTSDPGDDNAIIDGGLNVGTASGAGAGDIKVSGSFTFGADVVLNRYGADELGFAAGDGFRVADYVMDSDGYRVTGEGHGFFRYLYATELHAKSFIADLEQALAGGQIICKSVAPLAADFTCPAAGAAADLVVQEFQGFGSFHVFVDADIVRVRSFSRAGSSLTIGDCWGTVVYASRDATNQTQTYTFTRSAAPNAGSLAAATVIGKGTLALDYGTTGNGYIESVAQSGAMASGVPYQQIVTWATHPATGLTVRTRLGNLNGVYGIAADYFGIGLGDYAGGNYLRYETNGGFVLKAGDNAVTIDSDGITNQASTTYVANAAYKIVDASSNILSRWYSAKPADAGASTFTYLETLGLASRGSEFNIASTAGASAGAVMEIGAYGASGGSISVRMSKETSAYGECLVTLTEGDADLFKIWGNNHSYFTVEASATGGTTTVFGDLDVQGGDITNTTGAITLTPKAGDDVNIVGLLDLSNAASGQIKFPAAINASADANTLDDYEEGTWTPAFAAAGGTYTPSVQVGTYTKIGRQVTVHCSLTASAWSLTGNLSISGLPFACKTLTNYNPTGAIQHQNITYTGELVACAVSGSSNLFIFVVVSAGAWAQLQGAAGSATTAVRISLTYEV